MVIRSLVLAILFIAPSFAWGQVFSGDATATNLTIGKVRSLLICTVNTTGTGAQDIALAQSDTYIATFGVYVKTSITGVVSSSFVTDDTVPVTVIGTTLLTNLTGGRNLTAYTQPFFLGISNKIRVVHVGTASGGTILVGIEYFTKPDGSIPIICL